MNKQDLLKSLLNKWFENKIIKIVRIFGGQIFRNYFQNFTK